MFDKRTVFILGAGASWHYGYPTGEDLVKRVEERALQLAEFFGVGSQNGSGSVPKFVSRNVDSQAPVPPDIWHRAEHEAQQLAKRLKEVNPTVIDYFLAQNPDLHDIGRFVIALVLFDCEAEYESFGRINRNHKRQFDLRRQRGLPTSGTIESAAFNDDWLRFVLFKTTADCTPSARLSENKVHFITFNYDTSVERRLFRGLCNISHFQPSDIHAFMARERFLHIYGALSEKYQVTWSSRIALGTTYNSDFHKDVESLNVVYDASLGIKTIDGPGKEENQDVLAKAKEAIADAEIVYIFGFGFDSRNVERIGLKKVAPSERLSRKVFLTNYGGHARVSIAAGTALTNSARVFLKENVFQSSYHKNEFSYEMSLKNVYDAIAEDFEPMEAI